MFCLFWRIYNATTYYRLYSVKYTLRSVFLRENKSHCVFCVVCLVAFYKLGPAPSTQQQGLQLPYTDQELVQAQYAFFSVLHLLLKSVIFYVNFLVLMLWCHPAA